MPCFDCCFESSHSSKTTNTEKIFYKNPNHFACKQNVHSSKVSQWLLLDIKGYDNKEQVGPMRKRTSFIWPHITWNKNYSYHMSSQWLTFDAQLNRQHHICCKYDFIPCKSSNCTCKYAAAYTVQYRYPQMTCFGAVRHNCCSLICCIVAMNCDYYLYSGRAHIAKL